MLTRSAFTLLALLALPTLADYNAGVGAYSRKDFPAARAAFAQVAELADPQAQRALASMFARGEGGPVDMIEAYAWAGLAAEQGDATGIKIHDAIAASLTGALKTQAEARQQALRDKFGIAAVKRNLYPIVSANEPAVFDLQMPPARIRQQKQIDYPERAREKLEQGYACLSFYVDSSGKAVDIRRYDGKGSGGFAGAIEKGIADWSFEPEPQERRVGYCLEFLLEDDKTFRTTELVQSQLSKARKGDARSLSEVARDFQNSQHSPSNRVETQTITETWLNAALAGSADAQFELASRLYRGDGCVTEPDKAVRWLQLAIAQNHVGAQQFVALQLSNNKALALTPIQISSWLRSAADTDNAAAKLQLAKLLLRPGAEQDAATALALLKPFDEELHIHVLDWRAYAKALLGNFDGAVSDAEDALEQATDLGLATAARQASLTNLSNGAIPALPTH